MRLAAWWWAEVGNRMASPSWINLFQSYVGINFYRYLGRSWRVPSAAGPSDRADSIYLDKATYRIYVSCNRLTHIWQKIGCIQSNELFDTNFIDVVRFQCTNCPSLVVWSFAGRRWNEGGLPRLAALFLCVTVSAGIGVFGWLVGRLLTTQLTKAASHPAQIAVEERPIRS